MTQPRPTPSLGLRRETYYRLSPSGRRLARRVAFAPLDAWTILRGRPVYNGIPLPLRGEVFTGGGDFLTVGRRFLGLFERLGGMRPSDDVLEIGSGQGRMAIPLTAYLDEQGSYVGFDIVPDAVADCQRRISSRFPAFRFIALPVHNDLYTSGGGDAAAVRFPLEDDSIDFAFATSVFTHMEPEAIEHYLVEARRVVRQGGRLLATLFHMDPVARIASADRPFRFPHREGDIWYMSLRTRSANVAIGERSWAAMVERAGWRQEALHPGTWSGRPGSTLDYQDIAVLSAPNRRL